MNSKRGYLLPMALIFTTISLIIGFTVYMVGYHEQMSSFNRLNREKAFYLAEAGLQRAFAHLKNSTSWVPPEGWSVDVPLGEGTFLVTEAVNGDTILLTSVGTVRGITENVELTLNSNWGGGSIFTRGFFGDANVTIGNNAFLDSYNSESGPYGFWNHGYDAQIGSDAYVRVNNNGIVRGDASVSTGDPSDISRGSGAVISGTQDSNAEDLSLPPIVIPAALSSLSYPVSGDAGITTTPPGDATAYSLVGGTLTVNGGKTVNLAGGDWKFYRIVLGNNSHLTVTDDTRLYLVNNWTLNNNSHFTFSGTAEVYVDGQITVANNAILSSQPGANNMAIYITSGLTQTFANNSVSFSGVVYAPNATVNIGNNGAFYGAVVANRLTISNNAMVHFDTALLNNAPPGSPRLPGTLHVMRWRKPDWANHF